MLSFPTALPFALAALLSLPLLAVAHEDHQHPADAETSVSGDNDWNQGEPPADWWGAIRNQHGHVGPWNVLGYQAGLMALERFDTAWGRHDLDITVHTPLAMPYTCIADGLVVGTGNSIGRLDIRLAEVNDPSELFVVVKRKDGEDASMRFTPSEAYWKALEGIGPENMEAIARTVSEGPIHKYLDFAEDVGKKELASDKKGSSHHE